MKSSWICIFLLISVNFVWAQKEGLAPSNGVDIHYKIFGKGQPLLIINGGPGFGSEGFIPLAREFGENYQAIIYDQRGTGKSTLNSLSASSITMDLMVEDMEALRRHLNIDKWTLLGHSFGGIMAAYYTTKHPDRVERIVFSSSGGLDLELLNEVGQRVNSRLTQQERDSLAYWNAQIRGGDNSYRARLGRGMALAPAYVNNKEHVPVIAQRLTEGNMPINSIVWSDLRRINYDTKDLLRTFDKPVLIIQGKDDILNVSIAENAHRVLPNSKLVLLDDCGHYGWLDRKAAYFEAIYSFLDKAKG